MEQTFRIFTLYTIPAILCVQLQIVEAKDSTVNADFEGERLVGMGVAMNNPLLRLLGRTFSKLKDDVTKDIDNKTTFVLKEIHKGNSSLERRLVSERKELIDALCQIHTCTDWNTWSDCTAKWNGVQTRSRTCGINGFKLCPNSDTGQTDDESRVCKGQCPNNYTLTTNGFCIGMHTDKSLNWIDAQVVCQQEGGNLVNIDSEVKAVDVNSTLQQISSTFVYWIDGTRTLPAGEWKYENAPKDSMYTNWLAGEPSSIDDCKSYVRWMSQWLWWGIQCSSKNNFICEIV